MGMPPIEALRRLCVEFGWSYAVFWRAIAAAGNAPTHLTWEDGYYAHKSDIQTGVLTDLNCQANDDVRMLFNKMRASQVHAVGDGLIGEVASLGNHQWVVCDKLHKCGPFASKGIAEINCQIQAGIQTIAVVPVLPYGIVQFGSMQKLLEDTAFVHLVKGLFSHIIGGLGNLQSDSTWRSLVLEGHMYSLPSTLITACQSISSSPPLDVLPRHSIELVKFFPKYFPESHYSVLSPSDKVPPAALGVMPDVQMSETTHSPACQNQLSAVSSDLSPKVIMQQAEKLLLTSGSCGKISESDVLGSCSVLLSGTSQKHDHSRLNSILADHSLHTAPFDTYGACPLIANGPVVLDMKERELLLRSNSGASVLPFESSASDLFDLLSFDCIENSLNGGLDDVLASTSAANSCKSSKSTSKSLSILNIHSAFDVTGDEISCSEVFSVTDSDQLLDAMISNISSGDNQGLDYIGGSHCSNSANKAKLGPSILGQEQELPPVIVNIDMTSSSYDKTSREIEDQPHGTAFEKSHIRMWVESGQSIYNDSMSTVNSKKLVDGGKLTRKRPRAGENPKPRPKDRQMIQDRVKELREIVPNSAKCSIDALLEKTIKHMLFLQSVTKHADKLKDTGEPKISAEEGGFLLKDNFEGGATWAFEVGTQNMKCPIIVEDLNPPRQLLVEMLCEERGFFLEIADFIRGLGLTILKGVMVARKNKVWARFDVEANRDVTRMEIFLSLVRLLEPRHGGSNVPPLNVDNINMPRTMFHQNTIPATGLSNLS